MKPAWALAGLLACADCVAYRLSPTDQASAKDIAELALRTYQREPAGSVTSAFARAEYCSASAILERNGAAPPDPGGAITCKRKTP